MLSIPQAAQTDADKNGMGCWVPGESCVCRGWETKVSGANVPLNFAECTSSFSRGLSAGAAAAMAPLAHPHSSAAQLSGDSTEAEKAPCWLC